MAPVPTTRSSWSARRSAPRAGELDETRAAVGRLADALLAHLAFEEEQLLEPLGRLAIRT